MATKRVCDRCGAEINPCNSVTYAGMRRIKADANTEEYELCASCAHKLRKWFNGEENDKPVVRGRWTAQCVVEMDGGWALEDMPYNEYQHSNPICSICRKTALLDGGEDYVTSPYCPNCGARMDGDSDD